MNLAMRFVKTALLPFLIRHLGAILVVGLTTLLLRPLNSYLGAQVVALVYLMPVLLATFLWGLTPGILAGFTSFLFFNYFFLPPYHTLVVHKTQDLITLLVFLVIAVVTSQLIGQAREGMRLARQHEWEATRMYELTLALAGLQDIHSIARTLAEHTLETFRCRRVEVLIENPSTSASFLTVLPEGASNEPAPAPSIRSPMMTGRGLEGEIRLWKSSVLLSKEENRLLNTFASQGALAIERIRLTQSETKAHILEETDRAKSSLLSSVSHELRSPLAAIKASVSSLHSGMVDWDTSARQELLATIEEETDHLNFLVGNLLDMSRIEAGALKPQRRWNALSEIAGGVLARLRGQLKDYHVSLDFPPEFPLVPCDYVLITQVFTNLISNSIKFAPPASEITITAAIDYGDDCLNSDAHRGCAHVRVTNEGPPVPEESLERMFDKFTQVHVKERITGTGLGLSICKGIIEAHEGKIWAENTPCCFVFHFTLPLEMDGTGPQVPPESTDDFKDGGPQVPPESTDDFKEGGPQVPPEADDAAEDAGPRVPPEAGDKEKR